MPTFSLRTLLIVPPFIAIACATFAAKPSVVLSCSVLTFCVVGLLATPLGIVYRRGSGRAFWVGATVFGWGYLLVAYSEAIGLRNDLAMGEWMEWLHSKVHGNTRINSVGRFTRMGNAYAAVTLAALGGLLGRYLHATQNREESEDGEVS